MATTDIVADPLRLGQTNQAGSTEALFLKVFAGEVVVAYEEKVDVGNNIDMRSMPRGAKSVQVRGVGKAFTRRREVGANLLTSDPANDNITPSIDRAGGEGAGTILATSFLSSVNQGEREVFVDDPLVTAEFIDDFEQFKNSFDASGPISTKMGEALAVDNDELILRLIVRGVRSFDWDTSSLPDEFKPLGGTATDTDTNTIIEANAKTDGSSLLDALRQVSEGMDDFDVPDDGRFVALRPAQYNLLVQNQDLLNRDFGGQNGIFSDGTVFRAWGMQLVKTNRLPITDLTSGAAGDTGVRNPIGYNAQAAEVAAAAWHRGSVVGVRAGMVSMQRQFLIQYQGDLLVARMATGYDIVRPRGTFVVATS